LQLDRQAHFKAGDEPLFHVADFRRRGIAGEDDLLAAVAEGVEGVEEFLLGAVLAGEELDVVDEQDVDLPVIAAELGQLSVLDGADVVVGELLAGDVRIGASATARAAAAAKRLFSPTTKASKVKRGLRQPRLSPRGAGAEEEALSFSFFGRSGFGAAPSRAAGAPSSAWNAMETGSPKTRVAVALSCSR
jgi:hypothetical protein